MKVPDYVTHYYLPGRRPFLNLSDVEGNAVFDVIHDLNALRREGVHDRPFGRRYLEWRRLTEVRLRESFEAVGGKPERQTPHYFCLGESRAFAGLARNMQSVAVPLDALPSEQCSFTLIDSFGAFGFGPDFGYPDDAAPYQRVVYRLDDLDDVARRYELPGPASGDYVEVQLWSDEPVRQLLGVRG